MVGREYPPHFYYCKVCGHEVSPSVRKDVFYHYNRSDEDVCRHDCEEEQSVEVSWLPVTQWAQGKAFSTFNASTGRRVR